MATCEEAVKSVVLWLEEKKKKKIFADWTTLIRRMLRSKPHLLSERTCHWQKHLLSHFIQPQARSAEADCIPVPLCKSL